MCGIVGYTGPRDASPIILNGLRRLEYRGYDSAGLAVLTNNHIEIRRKVGKLDELARLLAEQPVSGHVGIGHTRWATHGEPSDRNAHPHKGMTGDVVVVHNGIVENFLELRNDLQAEGAEFASDTDTETIVHLLERYIDAGMTLEEAARATFPQLKGAQAIVAMSRREPDRIIACRIGNAGGVAIGIGDGEMFVASDIPAILEHTRQMVFLESRQMATITADGYYVQTLDGEPVTPEVHTVPWDPVSAAKGEYKHFMQKEIFEQPRAVTDTIRGRVDFEHKCVRLPEMNLTPEIARRIKRINTVACGTSYYSGLVGKMLIERIARIPVDVSIGSEFRYADPLIDESVAVLAITQSGETVDTLAAMEEAREKGALLWSIVNAIGSQAMRIADGYIAMQAGPEIGVASTKAFTTSIIDQYLLACYLAQLRNGQDPNVVAQYVADLARLPDLVGQVLDHDDEYHRLALEFYHYNNFLYLGRGLNYPIALEGALKLKEISYIHAEGYPAGEMKHGPIALIDENMPVLAIATRDHVYDKMLSQIEQAKARGGVVIALATEGDELIHDKADYVITVPETPELLSPVINVLPLQLLAYHIAVRRGADVDQPRNLAKSVTVE
ncbi:MAG: glutamine--fructose-6-phosphate transaminase (isomerizing) [Aggregatilineales bacterium]|nr:glutamine--fructose-6-phosphate transaminase (isomerizing) [Aggregatilineales bacterium]HQE19905.1 glutamine--fructose-6-phosphate transaminase (isomerizing) [Aggregatilineales bacterium]